MKARVVGYAPLVDPGRVLAVLLRAGGREVRATWRGGVLDLRVWAPAAEGGLEPTEQGVSVRAEEIGALAGAVAQAMGLALRERT